MVRKALKVKMVRKALKVIKPLFPWSFFAVAFPGSALIIDFLSDLSSIVYRSLFLLTIISGS